MSTWQVGRHKRHWCSCRRDLGKSGLESLAGIGRVGSSCTSRVGGPESCSRCHVNTLAPRIWVLRTGISSPTSLSQPGASKALVVGVSNFRVQTSALLRRMGGASRVERDCLRCKCLTMMARMSRRPVAANLGLKGLSDITCRRQPRGWVNFWSWILLSYMNHTVLRAYTPSVSVPVGEGRRDRPWKNPNWEKGRQFAQLVLL